MRLDRLAKEVFKERFPPRKVVFRVDAGRIRGVSFGHLFRCMRLAGELKRSYGTEVILLMRDYRDGISCARSFGYRVVTLKLSVTAREHDKAVMSFIEKAKPETLVVDLPFGTPNRYLDYARSRGIATVCIDDMARRSFRADVLLNSGILAERHKYRACLPRTRFLLGMKYYPSDERRGDKEVKKRNGKLRILFAFGGSDPAGLTERSVRSLAGMAKYDATFDIVLGPGFKGRRSIARALRPLADKAAIIDHPKDLMMYFRKSDLVVCAGGTTLYDLYAIGKSCIAIASNASESKVIEKFIEKKLILSGLKKWDEGLFQKELKRFVENVPCTMAKK